MDQLEQTDQLPQHYFPTDDLENCQVGAGDYMNMTNFINWNAGSMHECNIF